jgi:hypothetical protein
MCFVYNNPKVKFIRISNYLYYLIRTKRNRALAYYIFNRNTSISDHNWRSSFTAETAKANDKLLSHYQFFYFPDRPDFFLGPPSFLYSFGQQE